MLQPKKTLNGLLNMNFAYMDSTPRAEHTFHLYDFPETFYLGKNSFKIFVDRDNLVDGSQIYIDIIDARGNSIYYKVSNQISPDRTRNIIVHIYDTTPIGECLVLIAGRLKQNPKTKQPIRYSNEPTSVDYKNIPNVIWKGKVNVSLTENVTDITFDSLPIVTYQEMRIPQQEYSSSGSRIYNHIPSSSILINLTSITNPSQLKQTNLNTERTSDGDVIVKLPTNISGSGRVESYPKIPSNIQYSILKTNMPFFSSSMEGGNIFVNNITYDRPKNSLTTFVSQSYSGSIIEVINSTSCKIYPPFDVIINYLDSNGINRKLRVDKFINHSNFTASYLRPLTFVENTSSYTSYIKLRIENAEPELGSIKYLNISYKELNKIGLSIDLGQYPVPIRNLLVDPSLYEYSTTSGIENKSIGKFTSTSIYDTYWSGSTNTGYEIYPNRTGDQLSNSLLMDTSVFTNSNNFAKIHLLDQYLVDVYKNTEYELSFNIYTSPQQTIPSLPIQLDVYVSGSSIIESIPSQTQLLLPLLNIDGVYLGSITDQYGLVQNPKFNFKANTTGKITPIFIFRSIPLEIGNISLTYRNEIGYSPNTIEQEIRIPDLTERTEVQLNIEYLNSKKYPSDSVSKVYGVEFQGNTLITGSAGTTSLPSGLISSSKQIASDISGAFTQLSSSLSQRITIFETKTLFSSSQQVQYSQISGIPSGLVSGSDQLSGSYDLKYELKGRNVISSSFQIANDISGAFTQTSSSLQSRISIIEGKSLFSSSQQVQYSQISGIPSGLVSGSDQLTSSYDLRYHRLGTGLFSSSQQVNYNQISNIPTNLVSGSDQLSGSYDLKYELKGRNVISSSQQILQFGFLNTSSYQIDSSSWNSNINNINNKIGSFASTGSNIFIGNQIITGSLTVTNPITGSILSSSYAISASYAPTSKVPSGLLSSSQQIASDISGSFRQVSGSLASEIAVFETKTLFSSSQQVIFNQINGVPSGLISSSHEINTGSFSGSFFGNGSNLTNIQTSSYSLTASYTTTPICIIYSQSGQFTYNIPAGCRWLQIDLVGGGGGGGGGCKRTDSIYGAFGGYAGGYSFMVFDIKTYTSTSLHLVVGQSGSGGAGATAAAPSYGVNGTDGGDSYIASGSTIFCKAAGGYKGIRAEDATTAIITGDPGYTQVISDLPVRERIRSIDGTMFLNQSSSFNKVGGNGGHGGSGRPGATLFGRGGDGGYGYYVQTTAGTGGIYGGSVTQLSGSNGVFGSYQLFQTGGGGGGGATTGSRSAGPGGNGGIGAGGGGGGSTDTGNAGKGGNGGPGMARIIAFFN